MNKWQAEWSTTIKSRTSRGVQLFRRAWDNYASQRRGDQFCCDIHRERWLPWARRLQTAGRRPNFFIYSLTFKFSKLLEHETLGTARYLRQMLFFGAVDHTDPAMLICLFTLSTKLFIVSFCPVLPQLVALDTPFLLLQEIELERARLE